MTIQTIADQDVSDAYLYLLGRLLILRQQQLDFQEGFTRTANLAMRRAGDERDGLDSEGGGASFRSRD